MTHVVTNCNSVRLVRNDLCVHTIDYIIVYIVILLARYDIVTSLQIFQAKTKTKQTPQHICTHIIITNSLQVTKSYFWSLHQLVSYYLFLNWMQPTPTLEKKNQYTRQHPHHNVKPISSTWHIAKNSINPLTLARVGS